MHRTLMMQIVMITDGIRIDHNARHHYSFQT